MEVRYVFASFCIDRRGAEDNRIGIQCIGNEKQSLENLVRDAERAADLVRRETSLLDRGLQSLSEECSVVDDDKQHLLE